MKGDYIPDVGHVARYCPSRTVVDGNIQATAFMLREIDSYLSVNWLENLGCPTRAAEIRELQRVFAAKMGIGANAKFAVLGVGQLISHVLQESSDVRKLELKHEPETNDQSHSGIHKLRHDDEEIAELIAQVIQEVHPARG